MTLVNPLLEIDKTPGISPTISCFGDSLTAGTGGTPYPTFLSWYYRRLVNNFGVGGQTAQQIACRQGGLPIYLGAFTFNNQTAVSITPNYQFLSTPADNTTRTMSGTINGIQCIITRTASGGPPSTTETYTILPVGNNTTAIPANSQFLPDDGLNATRDIQILWLGRNNVPTLTGLDGWIDSCVGKLHHPRRVLIIGVKNAQNETNGTANKTAIDAMNVILQGNYPNNYVSIAPPTQAEATAVGYGTFTTQDITDIANGIFPATFHFDNVHFNSYGYQVIANRCISLIGNFGW